MAHNGGRKNTMKFFVILVSLGLLASCQSPAPSNPDESGYSKRKRGGEIRKATRDPRDFKDKMSVFLLEEMKKEKRLGLGLFLLRIEDHKLLYASAIGQADGRKGRGSFSGTDLLPAGSSSLWVSSAILLRLVAKKQLRFNSTTGKILGWKGPVGKITLRGLLSSTSGLPGRPKNFDCFSRVGRTIQDCATELYGRVLKGDIPLEKEGEKFSYGPSHIQIAAAMAERVTSMKWVDIAKSELVRPLKLDNGTAFYTRAAEMEGQSNPSAFEGLMISMLDYSRFLRVLVDNGGKYLPEQFVHQMLSDQFSLNTEIESSPMKTLLKKDYHMGYGNWIECEPGGDQGCEALNINSCPGVYGWYPFIDEGRGYYGLLAALEGHQSKQKSAAPALRSWRILNRLREFLKDWRIQK